MLNVVKIEATQEEIDRAFEEFEKTDRLIVNGQECSYYGVFDHYEVKRNGNVHVFENGVSGSFGIREMKYILILKK